MSIHDIPLKIKSYWSEQAVPLISKIQDHLDVKEDTFIVLVIILVGLAGFGLGKLSAMEKGREPVTIKPANLAITTSSSLLSTQTLIKDLLVAAKGGTKYYFPTCSGASRISEANKIWFSSYAEAQAAGYTAAANCSNLK